MQQKNKLLEQFSAYVHSFDLDDPIIAQKYNHSLAVASFCADIASSLALNKQETLLAYTIGLLHEFGSFENWKKNKTFQNTALTLQLLFENGMIEKFIKDPEQQKTAFLAISAQKNDRLHTAEIKQYAKQFENSKAKEDELRMFAKILADANTLETFGMIKRKSFPIINTNYTKKELSPVVEKAFLTERKVHTSDVKSLLDQIVYLLSLIYALHYNYSIKFAKKIDFAQAIYDYYYHELSAQEQEKLWQIISIYKNKEQV